MTGSLLAIGNFDGVHRGHQHVVRRAVERAQERGVLPRVLTFEPPPAVVLGRGDKPRLTRPARKRALLAALDARLDVVVEPFTLELSTWPAERFVDELLVGRLGAVEVVVGEDFRFGKGRTGDLDTLASRGLAATPAPLVGDERGPFRSTRVRAAVEAGDLDDAARVLGRPHALEGRVVHGQARARQLGFPTANLEGVEELLPPYGVYACRVHGPGLEGAPAVANLGVRPTLSRGLGLEVHLLDFEGQLYGAELRVDLVARLRDERRFAGVAELAAQIARDVALARDVLGA